MTRRRIALLLPRLGRYGGVEQFAWNLSAALAEAGHEVDFICARKETDPPAGVRPIVVGRSAGLKSLKTLQFLFGAEMARRRGNYDLAISLGKTWEQDMLRVGGGPLSTFWELSAEAWPQGLSRTLKMLRRRLSPANWITTLVERRQYDGHSTVICVSDAVRDWTIRAFPGLTKTPPEVIYNLPDLTRFSRPSPAEKSEARRAYGLAEDAVVISTASSNFALKGIGPLIRAMSLLPDNFILLIAGGRDAGSYQRLAEELSVGERVRFLGKVDDMPQLYRASDIFALPTFYDACSNAVLEALASGVRTLSTTRNGSSHFLPPHWITDKPGDHEDLARRLASMILEPEPGPFLWPEGIRAGLPAWLERIDAALAEKERNRGRHSD